MKSNVKKMVVILVALTIIVFVILYLQSIILSNNKKDHSEIDANNETEKYVDSSYSAVSSVRCLDFDECISVATNIVSAKYIDTKQRGMYSDLTFEITEQLKGRIKEENIVVTVMNQYVEVIDTSIKYEQDYSKYSPGEEYVLILERHVSVYYDTDKYLVIGDIYIPKKHISDSTIYGEENISNWVPEVDTEINNYEAIISRIENSVDMSPECGYYGTDYIHSDNIEDIKEQTEFIFEVKVGESTGGSENNNTESFNCEVLNCLKGEANSEMIEIIFVADTVEEGNEYMVMLSHKGNANFYTLSSKYSVNPIKEDK